MYTLSFNIRHWLCLPATLFIKSALFYFWNKSLRFVVCLLISLKVLSSRLMPSVHDDAATQSSSQSFREIFLSSGGLSLVTRVLQKDTIPHDVDLETRRGCYSIALQLARCVDTVVWYQHRIIMGAESCYNGEGDSGSCWGGARRITLCLSEEDKAEGEEWVSCLCSCNQVWSLCLGIFVLIDLIQWQR